ncbi:hypothetical protein MMC22_008651 [Lobaria immixta]|nr:hypothetical protein [Lobaria immixta]
MRENDESRAQIASFQSGATATTSEPESDEEKPVGEVPPAALLVANRHPGLPKAEVAWIFNKYCSENLYRLRHLRVAGIETAKRISHSKMAE